MKEHILQALEPDVPMYVRHLRQVIHRPDNTGMVLHNALRQLEREGVVELTGGMDSYPHKPWTVRRVQ